MSSSLSFAIEAELSPSRFAEVGRPAGAYRRQDGRAVALVSDFEVLYWPARAIYEGHRLRHRISIYAGDLGRRLGVFDEARFPINDIAFHPSLPMIAIATGSYDGGWAFEGELLLWNWETGYRYEVLAENRDVARVRFDDDDKLALLLRPRTDEGYDGDDAFRTFFGGVIADLRPFAELGLRAGDADPRVDAFAPVAPAVLGFDRGFYELQAQRAQWEALLGGTGYEQRHRVWDLAWLDDERLLAVHDCCHAEEWTTAGRRTAHLRGAGHGIQVLRRRGATLVHVLEHSNPFTGATERSTLSEFREGRLNEIASFAHCVLFSVDRSGRILCRDTGDRMRKRPRCDRVIDAAGREIAATDLGHYDCFNHYLRLEGGDALYFLRGTPPTSHEAKILCGIDSVGKVHEHFRWDDEARHLMCSDARFLPDGSLIRAFRVHDPSPLQLAAYIEALDMGSGRSRWRIRVEALVTALEPIADRPWLVYALTDGRLGVIDWRSGDLLHEEKVSVGGIDSVVLSISARGDRLVCGTLDGRVLLSRVVQ